jgi:hypothetical protein
MLVTSTTGREVFGGLEFLQKLNDKETFSNASKQIIRLNKQFNQVLFMLKGATQKPARRSPTRVRRTTTWKHESLI